MPFGKTPPLAEMYVRQLWLVFFSIVWMALTTFLFFVIPPFAVVSTIVVNICGSGVGSTCTLYDFWTLTFWFGELAIMAGGVFWSMGFFD
jgi:hypothetical protein